jgi:hypothetical protein
MSKCVSDAVSKLVPAALIISILLAGLSIATILLGRGQPAQPDLFEYLGNCNGQPCYLGIVPGTTDWHTALDVLGNRPEIEFGTSTNFAFRPQGFSGTVLLLAANQTTTVGEIDLNMRPASISIGSLITHMGSPCAVVPGERMIGVIFPGMSVISFASDSGTTDAPKPTLMIDEINLFNRFQTCDQVIRETTDRPWRGFAHYTN